MGSSKKATKRVSPGLFLGCIFLLCVACDPILTESAYNSKIQSTTPTATPTFSPGAGTYATPQSVTISTTASGATIRYTTDGSTPTETVGTPYSGPINVTASETIKAIAYTSGWADSPVATASYTIGVATPTFSPGAGTYATAQSVTISTTTSGAAIRYTTDGSTPTETVGTLYSGPFSVTTSQTIKAIAYKSGLPDSTVSSVAYSITDWTAFGVEGVGPNQFNSPGGVRVDARGRIYVADLMNGRIVRINDMSGTGWKTFAATTELKSSPCLATLLWIPVGISMSLIMGITESCAWTT